MKNPRLLVELPVNWEQVAPNVFAVPTAELTQPILGPGFEELGKAYKLDDSELDSLHDEFMTLVHRKGLIKRLLIRQER